jgi:hypothetical protein
MAYVFNYDTRLSRFIYDTLNEDNTKALLMDASDCASMKAYECEECRTCPSMARGVDEPDMIVFFASAANVKSRIECSTSQASEFVNE